ncbi:MAG TPA: ABC transporter permease [Candidatus Acidoferrales bacterium]
METLWQDLRYAARQLLRSPGFTAVAVLTLALGIGANTAIFSVVNSVLLNPLPFSESERLVLLWQRSEQFRVMMVSYPDFLDYREQNTVFEEMALYNRYQNRNLTGVGEPQRLSAAVVTSGVFRVLRVQPALGRPFLPEEDERGAPKVALLGHEFWQRNFGGNQDVLGRVVSLDGEPFTIVGVLPPNLQFLQSIDVWLPMGTFVSDNLLNRGNHVGMVGIARLKPGASLEQARDEMDRIAKGLEGQYPDSNVGVGVAVNQLYEVRVGDTRPALLLLLGAVGFVLLIACANVANLLLSRTAARQKENAIRAAMGAGRGRLARLWLTESLLLAVVGGALGWLASLWTVDAIRAWGANQIPRATEIRLDERVLLYTLLAAVFTGVLVGLAPALQSARTNLSNALKEAGRTHSFGRGRSRLSGLLVVSEVALSFILLIGAGLLLWSFYLIQSVNPGFAARNVLTARLSLSEAKYPDSSALIQFSRELLDRAQSLPGVEAVGLTGNLPFSEDGWQFGIQVEGQPQPEPGKALSVEVSVISSDYFRAMSVPLLSGRPFNEQDTGEPLVVIVSDSFAKRFFPGPSPLGERIAHAGPNPHWMTIVGVVGDTNRNGLDVRSRPEIYMPYTQNPTRWISVVARTTTEPTSLAPALREQVQAIDPHQPLYGVQPMEQRVAASLGERRFSMTLLGGFAALAFLLAVIGLYSVISYSVSQRTHEIGIRMALGANRSSVLRLVLHQGLKFTLVGTAVGVCGALCLTRFASGLLYGITPTEPIVFVAVAALLAGVALLASWIPARRAVRVDPMVALRYE